MKCQTADRIGLSAIFSVAGDRVSYPFGVYPDLILAAGFQFELDFSVWLAIDGAALQCLAMSLHIRGLAGYNSHHIVEGAFKSVARSLKQAVAIDEADPNAIPSTKGVL